MNYKTIHKLRPKHLCLYYRSAWTGHAPFAMWLVGQIKPRKIVELGSHGGFSYFSFCEAVKRNNLDCQCYAIDTWQGDDQAGEYDNSIYLAVNQINQADYSDFSTLIRKRFDQAAGDFSEKSIDLLHIDGRHGYEDIKEDFLNYKDKLSPNAVVLFHDVCCDKPGFGVQQFFSELSQDYPAVHFTHCYGFGIIGPRDFIDTLKNAPHLLESLEAAGERITALYRLLSKTSLRAPWWKRRIKNKFQHPYYLLKYRLGRSL
jgi:predicted O-methyltransferase YrrM